MKLWNPVHFVVIDDVCRFALHLWSYLADIPGFGIGDVSSSDELAQYFWEKRLPRYLKTKRKASPDRGKPTGLVTPDGLSVVWWVEARGDSWGPQLEKVLEAIEGSRPNSLSTVRFLIDVRGPYREEGDQRYDHARVLKSLEQRGFKTDNDRVILVSSYKRLLREDLVVHEKAAATFERMKRLARVFQENEGKRQTAKQQREEAKRTRVKKRKKRAKRPEKPTFHVLVTGAGFDLGGQEPVRGLGSGFTSALLMDALELVEPKPPKATNKAAPGASGGFPIPKGLEKWKKRAPAGLDRLWMQFENAAEKRDLDLYWEFLLKLELERSGGSSPEESFDKVAAAAREHQLREAFRSALAHHDWGLTSQTLDALREPRFETWLTTNYTRFPNRALDILDGHGPNPEPDPADSRRGTRENRTARGHAGNDTEEEAGRPWRVVATSNEATTYLRTILHREVSLARDAEEGPGLGTGPRYLFKLHGDIPHVTTMALAASDKEVYSPLSMPIDSLHWLYTTAEKHLEHLISRAERDVVWHIVGHGLKDRLLVDLLVRVCRATHPASHHFLIMGWNGTELSADDDPGDILKRALGSSTDWCIQCIEAKAQDYLARLRADRLLETGARETDFLEQFRQWIEHHGFCQRRQISPGSA